MCLEEIVIRFLLARGILFVIEHKKMCNVEPMHRGQRNIGILSRKRKLREKEAKYKTRR